MYPPNNYSVPYQTYPLPIPTIGYNTLSPSLPGHNYLPAQGKEVVEEFFDYGKDSGFISAGQGPIYHAPAPFSYPRSGGFPPAYNNLIPTVTYPQSTYPGTYHATYPVSNGPVVPLNANYEKGGGQGYAPANQGYTFTPVLAQSYAPAPVQTQVRSRYRESGIPFYINPRDERPDNPRLHEFLGYTDRNGSNGNGGSRQPQNPTPPPPPQQPTQGNWWESAYSVLNTHFDQFKETITTNFTDLKDQVESLNCFKKETNKQLAAQQAQLLQLQQQQEQLQQQLQQLQQQLQQLQQQEQRQQQLQLQQQQEQRQQQQQEQLPQQRGGTNASQQIGSPPDNWEGRPPVIPLGYQTEEVLPERVNFQEETSNPAQGNPVIPLTFITEFQPEEEKLLAPVSKNYVPVVPAPAPTTARLVFQIPESEAVRPFIRKKEDNKDKLTNFEVKPSPNNLFSRFNNFIGRDTQAQAQANSDKALHKALLVQAKLLNLALTDRKTAQSIGDKIDKSLPFNASEQKILTKISEIFESKNLNSDSKLKGQLRGQLKEGLAFFGDVGSAKFEDSTSMVGKSKILSENTDSIRRILEDCNNIPKEFEELGNSQLLSIIKATFIWNAYDQFKTQNPSIGGGAPAPAAAPVVGGVTPVHIPDSGAGVREGGVGGAPVHVVAGAGAAAAVAGVVAGAPATTAPPVAPAPVPAATVGGGAGVGAPPVAPATTPAAVVAGGAAPVAAGAAAGVAAAVVAGGAPAPAPVAVVAGGASAPSVTPANTSDAAANVVANAKKENREAGTA